MIRLALLVLAVAACSREPIFVVPKELTRGDGGIATQAQPQFDVLVKMGADSTDFDPEDVMVLQVDGADRTEEMILGSEWALLRIDPPPLGMRDVQLFRRQGRFIDNFTWDVLPYTGPTITGVAPDTARIGTSVDITGTGFDQGVLRVFIGAAEAVITGVSPTLLTATVPAAAGPGLVWVLVDDTSASGVVGFQPLHLMDQPIPFGTEPRLFAAFPGSAPIEVAVQFYGVNFDNTFLPIFNERRSPRIFGLELVDVPPIGEILSGFAVADDETIAGEGFFRIELNTAALSNDLPFTVK